MVRGGVADSMGSGRAVPEFAAVGVLPVSGIEIWGVSYGTVEYAFGRTIWWLVVLTSSSLPVLSLLTFVFLMLGIQHLILSQACARGR